MTTHDTRIAEIEAREKAASPGPWKHYCLSMGPGSTVPSGQCLVVHIHEGDEIAFAEVEDANGRDAGFIAHARQDIPYLLAEVKRLRDVLEWYADENNYLSRDQNHCLLSGMGYTARKALEGE